MGLMHQWQLQHCIKGATQDRMAGLLNHQEAVKSLAYQINVSDRSNHPICIAYIDLNDLKPMNDTLGPKSGDQMIIAAADSIKEAVRKTDLAARVGGDEFLIIHGAFMHRADKAMYTMKNEYKRSKKESR